MTKKILIVMFASILLLAGCQEPKTWDTPSPHQVEWVEINPPPGVEGSCWAFYESNGYRGFSGVHCGGGQK